MYSGTLSAVSNREDWTVAFSFTDENNDSVTVSGAIFNVFVTQVDTPNTAIITGSTEDGTVTIDANGIDVSWTFPGEKMSALCAGNYWVFARMKLNGSVTQIFSEANLSVVEGGPAQ